MANGNLKVKVIHGKLDEVEDKVNAFGDLDDVYVKATQTHYDHERYKLIAIVYYTNTPPKGMGLT